MSDKKEDVPFYVEVNGKQVAGKLVSIPREKWKRGRYIVAQDTGQIFVEVYE